jgi:hypothetical protein
MAVTTASNLSSTQPLHWTELVGTEKHYAFACRAYALLQSLQHYISLLQPDSWSTVSEGFVGDPWLSITLTLCHILHSVSHWPVLVYFISIYLPISPCTLWSLQAQHTVQQIQVAQLGIMACMLAASVPAKRARWRHSLGR